MRTIAVGLLMALVIISAAGCSRKKEPPAGKPTRVSATPRFERYFGPAPTTDKGTCYAFVIYFPSAQQPGKVLPFPFFTFDEATTKKVAVQRLIAGMDDLKNYRGELLQPFPPGTRLLSLEEKGGTVTADLSPQVLGTAPDPARDRAAVTALVMTLSQFQGVRGVRILADGKESRLTPLIRAVGESDVLPLPPPRLLSVTAMKERGEPNVEEVDAFFDRPVEIKTLRMGSPDGTAIEGEIYHSVFDMAAVLKPKDPSLFKAGMPIKITWDVTDKLGRHAAGESEIPLEIKEH